MSCTSSRFTTTQDSAGEASRRRAGSRVRVARLLLVAAAVSVPMLGVPIGARSGPGPAMEELGRLLFWDPILSGARDVACATCHHPAFAYADGRELSLGTGAVGLGPERVDGANGRAAGVRRNSPTVLNTGFNGLGRGRRARRRRGRIARRAFDGTVASVDQASAPMFWDNRVGSLEAQALEPIKAFEEMRGTAYAEQDAVASVVARLQGIPDYAARFEGVFGTPAIQPEYLGRAIAAFERSLVAMNSPVDRFLAGDTGALTDQERRGMEAFDAAGCDRCHGGVMFSDYALRAEGVKEHPLLSEPDEGGGRFRFRTPTLRNVALTAPYMHNGVLATLEDVLRFYDEGRSENPYVSNERGRRGDGATPRVDGRFRRIRDMDDGAMQDIIAFLGALTDEGFDRQIPAKVPSGLQVGGQIGE